MGAWLEDLRPGLFRQHRADREAAPQPFGAGENVRDDVVMLVGVEMAGTPGAGLHLIEYQSGMMAIAEGTQRLQERRVRRDHPAFADNRLDDHRAGARGDRRGDRLDIVIGQMGNALRQRSIIAGIFRLAANGDGEQRAAVEGVVEGDDFAFFTAKLIVGIFPRQLKGRLVGFGAGVAEKHLVGKGRLHEGFRQLQHRLVGIAIADMPQFRQLILQGLSQRRVSMAQGVHCDAARHIDILFPLLVPDAGARRSDRNKRRGGKTGNQVSVKIFASHTA